MVSFVDSHSLQIDLWTPNNNLTDEGLHNTHFHFPQNFYELYTFILSLSNRPNIPIKQYQSQTKLISNF